MDVKEPMASLLFPAHAGVILADALFVESAKAIPRTRGGDPFLFSAIHRVPDYSPHTRG